MDVLLGKREAIVKLEAQDARHITASLDKSESATLVLGRNLVLISHVAGKGWVASVSPNVNVQHQHPQGAGVASVASANHLFVTDRADLKALHLDFASE